MKKYILPAMLLLLVAPAQAQHLGNPDVPFGVSDMINGMGDTLLYIILAIAVLMLFLVVVVYVSVIRLRNNILAENDPKYAAQANQSLWGMVFQVSHTSTDKEKTLDHNYDDIHELDNPIPSWFMWLFYITVVFGVGYLVHYHLLGSGKLQEAEYTAEVEKAEKDYQVYLKTAGDKINAETVTLLSNKDEIGKGAELFAKNCVACHGKVAEGTNIAPNLTDEYWIHGGGIKNVFKTITEGVELKGMKSWKKDFSPVQIQQIASYVISLQGSNPANAKPPQGEKWNEGGAAPAAPAADSTTANTLTSMK